MRLHRTRPARATAALGVLAIATPLVAGEPAAGQTDTDKGLEADVRDTHVRYTDPIVVTGKVPGGDGTKLALEFRARGSEQWRVVDESWTRDDGSYRLEADNLRRSGEVRVKRLGARAAATGTAATSSAKMIRIAAKLRLADERLHVRAGRTAVAEGRLRPGWEGRKVTLEKLKKDGWTTVDKTRTGEGGKFRLTYRKRNPDVVRMRVKFAGDTANIPARENLPRMSFLRRSYASWYGPGFYGKRTACGQTYSASIKGVAHKSLPCGTKVTIRHGDDVVRARVIDRGPYAHGREFDLSRRVKQELGFGSTGRIWVAH